MAIEWRARYVALIEGGAAKATERMLKAGQILQQAGYVVYLTKMDLIEQDRHMELHLQSSHEEGGGGEEVNQTHFWTTDKDIVLFHPSERCFQPDSIRFKTLLSQVTTSNKEFFT